MHNPAPSRRREGRPTDGDCTVPVEHSRSPFIEFLEVCCELLPPQHERYTVLLRFISKKMAGLDE